MRVRIPRRRRPRARGVGGQGAGPCVVVGHHRLGQRDGRHRLGCRRAARGHHAHCRTPRLVDRPHAADRPARGPTRFRHLRSRIRPGPAGLALTLRSRVLTSPCYAAAVRRPTRETRIMRAAVLRNIGDEKLEIRDDLDARPGRPGRGQGQDPRHRRLPLRRVGHERHHPPARAVRARPRGRRRGGRGGRRRHLGPAGRPRHHRVEPAVRHAARSASNASSPTCASTCRWLPASRPTSRSDGAPIFGFAGDGHLGRGDGRCPSRAW